MPRKLELTALVDPDQFDAVKRLSERTRLPMSHHVREALTAYLAQLAAVEELARKHARPRAARNGAAP